MLLRRLRNSLPLSVVRLPFAGLLLLSLAACSPGNDLEDIQQYVIEVTLRPGGEIEPLPVLVPSEVFIYSAASLRSPFDIPVMAGATTADEPVAQVQPDFDRVPEPLESFALTSLGMVGMMTRGNQHIGLVRDESGSIHRVGTGNYLGHNHGRVISVSPQEISIVEIVPSGDGGWVERPRSLMLLR